MDSFNYAEAAEVTRKPGVCNGCELYDAPLCKDDPLRQVDLLIVGDHPSEEEVDTGIFQSVRNNMILQVIKSCIRELPKDKHITHGKTYAIKCPPESINAKPSVAALDKCNIHLQATIERSNPKVIMAMGALALKAVGCKQMFSSVRGSFVDQVIDGITYKIMPTFHPKELMANPGKTPTFKKDIYQVINYILDSQRDGSELSIKTPTTYEKIIQDLDNLYAGIQRMHTSPANKTGKVMLAVDIETTSLTPQNPDDRIIAISLSPHKDYGLAFPFEHRDAGLSEDQLIHIKDYLNMLFTLPYVMLGGHNIKFDVKWLRYKYGFNVPAPIVDTMLYEHILDEDKKGLYDLKSLTSSYFPWRGKYEKELKEILTKLREERNAKNSEVQGEYKEQRKERMLEQFYSATDTDVLKQIGDLVTFGHVELTETNYLLPKRKKTGELTKTFKTKAFSILRRVPVEFMENLVGFIDTEPPQKLEDITFEDIPIDILLRYAAIDAAMVVGIYKEQLKRFQEDTARIEEITAELRRSDPNYFMPTNKITWPLHNIIMPMSDVISHMEYHGVRIDRGLVKRYISDLTEHIEESRVIMKREIGYDFNPDSTQDLQKILFEELQYTPLKTSDKTGLPSTDADTLGELLLQKESPFLQQLLRYRKLVKCKGTYLENWLDRSSSTGRIHCNFNLNGTATGRLSSSDPNLQNVPFSLEEANLNLKDVFVPDSDDFDLYDMDISNAEMRVLCAYSNDVNLCDAFNNGKDLHCLTGSGFSGMSYEQIKQNYGDKASEEYRVRQIAKKVNFGTIYCMSSKALREQLWTEMRTEVTEEEAQSYLDGFFDTYPGVRKYINVTKAFVRRYGFIYTLTGRRRRFPLMKYSPEWMKSRILRQSVNTRIQSTSSDMVLSNLVDIHKWVTTLGGRILLTVHDSIVFQLPKEVKNNMSVKEALDKIIITDTRERFKWMPVPWAYDVERGPSYGHAKEKVE